MIKFLVTIHFRDDTKKTFDCVKYPCFDPNWIIVAPSMEVNQYIPKEAVGDVIVKDYWDPGVWVEKDKVKKRKS